MIYSDTPGYIDPLDPGTCTTPNIAATRGIAERGLPGGCYTTPRSMQILRSSTVRRRAASHSRSSAYRSSNLFNQLYNVPVYNGCYGIAGDDRPIQRNGTVHVLHRTIRTAR